MLDDVDLAVPPVDNALMDDYIMELGLASMSTTPAHMQGDSEAMLTAAVLHREQCPPDSPCCNIGESQSYKLMACCGTCTQEKARLRLRCCAISIPLLNNSRLHRAHSKHISSTKAAQRQIRQVTWRHDLPPAHLLSACTSPRSSTLRLVWHAHWPAILQMPCS